MLWYESHITRPAVPGIWSRKSYWSTVSPAPASLRAISFAAASWPAPTRAEKTTALPWSRTAPAGRAGRRIRPATGSSVSALAPGRRGVDGNEGPS